MIGFKRQNVSLLQQKPENKYLKNTCFKTIQATPIKRIIQGAGSSLRHYVQVIHDIVIVELP